MSQRKVYEGTLEEITAQYGLELRGRHLQVSFDDETAKVEDPWSSSSSKEWAKALKKWAAGHSSNATYLADEAINRAAIYEGRG